MLKQRNWEMACLYFEICGSSIPEDEYDEYGDEWVCPECCSQDGQWSDSFPMYLEYDEGE
jgi:hypothetical protein